MACVVSQRSVEGSDSRHGGWRTVTQNLINPKLTSPTNAAGTANRKRADEAYRHLFPVVLRLRAEGLSLAAIAAKLNASGERTRVFGCPWNPEQVRRVLARAKRHSDASESDASDAPKEQDAEAQPEVSTSSITPVTPAKEEPKPEQKAARATFDWKV